MRRFKAPPITRQNAPAFLGNSPITGPGAAHPIGDYSDPHYSEAQVFKGTPGEGRTAGALPVAPQYRNTVSALVYPFVISQTSGANGSVLILPANERRVLLIVQNQSETDNLYFNFGGDANNRGVLLPPGVGVFFDYACPNNSVSVFMDSATNQPGCVVEAAHTG